MTALLERPVEVEAAEPQRHAAPPRKRLTDRQISALWLVPLLAVNGVVHAWGMFRSPQRVDDEGTYMAQAFAVQKFGELAHYTFWYDHPPLGWLQLAAWTTVTAAFDRTATSVAAGREAMLLVQLVASVLLWLLVRRLGIGRIGAAVAVLLFGLSPLAIHYHRMVYLDNIAVLWLLAAFVLVLARNHQLAAYTGAAACAAMSVLTKETFVVVLPVLAWAAWRNAHADTRRYTLSIASSLFVLLCSGYLAFALLKSELIPGEKRVSLWGAIRYQLVDRPSGGAVWDRTSESAQTVGIWLALDGVLLAAGLACAVGLLFVKRLRPVAVAYLLLVALVLRPGYLPIPYVIAMLPFAAVLIAGAIDLFSRRRELQLVAVGAVGALGFAAWTLWPADLEQLTSDNADRPMAQAEHWLAANVEPGERVLVDDAVWVDLVRSDFDRDQVVWYFKADTDPAVQAKADDGWRDYDYLMVTDSVRGTIAIAADGGKTPYQVVTDAYEHSTVVAAYGSGDERVEIRKVGVRRTTTPDSAVVAQPAAPAVEPLPTTAPARTASPIGRTAAAPQPVPTQVAPAPTPSPPSSPLGGILALINSLVGGTP